MSYFEASIGEMAWRNREIIVDPDDFDPNEDYPPRVLEAYATAILQRDARETGDRHNILFDSHLSNRKKREHLVDALQIDPAFSKARSEDKSKTIGDGQAMFFRSHPEGRKVNSKEQRRRHGASYYRAGGLGSIGTVMIGLPIYITALILSIELLLCRYEDLRAATKRTRRLYARILQS